MEVQYQFNINGTFYDLVPNYPQEQKVNLEALNEVCKLLRIEQETGDKNPQISSAHREIIERVLRRKQNCIIDEIHRACYPKMMDETDTQEEILFQYLMHGKSYSLSQENREKILHFYTLIDSNMKDELLSPYGALLLADEKISDPLAMILLKKQLSKKTELKTPFLSGRMLTLMRDEYSETIKKEILNTYDDMKLKEEKQKFIAFFRGLALARELDDHCYVKKEPFYPEYQEACKVATCSSCSNLLRRTARAMCLLENEVKEREREEDITIYQKK